MSEIINLLNDSRFNFTADELKQIVENELDWRRHLREVRGYHCKSQLKIVNFILFAVLVMVIATMFMILSLV